MTCVNNTTKTSALIYPGAGYDKSFLSCFPESSYNEYILYDALPRVSHYKPGQHSYETTKNRKCFLHKLKRTYGCYMDRSSLYFPRNNITYNHSVDASTMEVVPPGDIYLRGYIPVSEGWINAFNDPKRAIYIACDTCTQDLDYRNIFYEIVHCCDGDYCSLDTTDSDTDTDSQ